MSEVKIVKFFNEGSFGNNLFQYFAAEIIKKIYNYDKTEPTPYINLELNTIITDEHFIKIIQGYLNDIIYPIDTSKDILLIGFFQRSEIYLKELPFIRSLFTQDNNNYISNRTRISNILKYKSKHTIIPSEDDLTLHIRLGDFYDKTKNKSQIYDPKYLKNIINTIPHKILYIVCDEPKEDWEKDYLKELTSLNAQSQVQIISGNLGDDFYFLMKSKKLITSASTMCWMAALLGISQEVHIPYNSYYGGYESLGQSLAEFGTNCKVYYDTEYWTPLQLQTEIETELNLNNVN